MSNVFRMSLESYSCRLFLSLMVFLEMKYKNLTEFNSHWKYITGDKAREIAHLLHPNKEYGTGYHDTLKYHTEEDYYIIQYSTDRMTRLSHNHREVYRLDNDDIVKIAHCTGINSGHSYAQRQAYNDYRRNK